MWESAAAILGDLTVGALLLIALAAFATALFHAVSGFAGGLLLSICLAPILGIKTVVPVVSVALILSNGNRTWLFRKAINWQVYWAVMRLAIPGIVAGAVLYVYLPVPVIALLLGIFLLVSVPLRRCIKEQRFDVGLRGLSVVGGGFGLIAGTVIGAGILLGPFLLGAGVVGESLVGLIAAIGLTTNLTKALVFGSTALLDPGMIIAGLMVGIWTIPGGLTGRWIVRNTSIRLHTMLVEGLIICGGCYFIYQGLT